MRRRVAIAVLAILCAASVPVAQEGTRFVSRVEAVRVDVLAMRGGEPLLGLTASDFEVFDNGVRQRVDRVAFEQIPLNVVVALDTSKSVEGERLDDLRKASRAILDRLKPADSAALVSFGQDVTIRSTMTRDIARVRSGLDALAPKGDTSLVDAVHTAILVGESQAGRALVLLFTDGLDASSYLQPQAVIDAARRAEPVVYAVVTRSVLQPTFLRDITRVSGGDLFEIESSKDVPAAFARVFEEFRRRYLLSYTPVGVEPHGWHELQVRVKQRGVTVRARSGYLRN